MPSRRPRKSSSLTTKLTEISFAAPQVVAHRLARLALASPMPSARDSKEFARMVAEKEAAFIQSWNAMTVQAVRANQQLALSLIKPFWLLGAARPSARSVASQIQHAALGVLDKGIEPVHRKAVANAKRLARTKLR